MEQSQSYVSAQHMIKSGLNTFCRFSTLSLVCRKCIGWAGEQLIEPGYKVSEVLCHCYCLEVPPWMDVHDVFALYFMTCFWVACYFYNIAISNFYNNYAKVRCVPEGTKVLLWQIVSTVLAQHSSHQWSCTASQPSYCMHTVASYVEYKE